MLSSKFIIIYVIIAYFVIHLSIRYKLTKDARMQAGIIPLVFFYIILSIALGAVQNFQYLKVISQLGVSLGILLPSIILMVPVSLVWGVSIFQLSRSIRPEWVKENTALSVLFGLCVLSEGISNLFLGRTTVTVLLAVVTAMIYLASQFVMKKAFFSSRTKETVIENTTIEENINHG